MTRTALVALLVAGPALAAPLPDHERDRLAVARTFGAWTDPLDENAFEGNGARLRLRLLGAPYRADRSLVTAGSSPRFVHTLRGDFTVVVRVDFPALTDGVSVSGRCLGGGLAAKDVTGSYASVWRYDTGAAETRLSAA